MRPRRGMEGFKGERKGGNALGQTHRGIDCVSSSAKIHVRAQEAAVESQMTKLCRDRKAYAVSISRHYDSTLVRLLFGTLQSTVGGYSVFTFQ